MDFFEMTKMIERHGFINKRGKRVSGTAALIHFAHQPVNSLNKAVIERGRLFIEKILSNN